MQNFGNSLYDLFRSVKNLIHENPTVESTIIPQYTDRGVLKGPYRDGQPALDRNTTDRYSNDTHGDAQHLTTEVMDLNNCILSPITITACRVSLQRLSCHIQKGREFNNGSFGQLAFLLTQSLVQEWIADNLLTSVENACCNASAKSSNHQ